VTQNALGERAAIVERLPEQLLHSLQFGEGFGSRRVR
jgi:hypothetical protein